MLNLSLPAAPTSALTVAGFSVTGASYGHHMEFTIDCRSCSRPDSASCEDCVVTFISNRQPDEAVVVDAAEFAALRRLADAGLIPAVEPGDGPWADDDVRRVS